MHCEGLQIAIQGLLAFLALIAFLHQRKYIYKVCFLEECKDGANQQTSANKVSDWQQQAEGLYIICFHTAL